MISSLHVKHKLIRTRLRENISQLINLIGEQFQIRDDYQNLQSPEVGNEPYLVFIQLADRQSLVHLTKRPM
jgi:hypothetical protein